MKNCKKEDGYKNRKHGDGSGGSGAGHPGCTVAAK